MDTKIIRRLRGFSRGTAGYLTHVTYEFNEVWELDQDAQFSVNLSGEMGLELDQSVAIALSIDTEPSYTLDQDLILNPTILASFDSSFTSIPEFNLNGRLSPQVIQGLDSGFSFDLIAETGIRSIELLLPLFNFEIEGNFNAGFRLNSQIEPFCLDASATAQNSFTLQDDAPFSACVAGQSGISHRSAQAIPQFSMDGKIRAELISRLSGNIQAFTVSGSIIAESIMTLDTVIPTIESQYCQLESDIPQFNLCEAHFIDPDYAYGNGGRDCYVMNTTNRAVCRLPDLNVNFMFMSNGQCYAVDDNTIYRLGADDDDGQWIACRIETHDIDFDESRHKRVPYAYVGSPYAMTLTTSVDGTAGVQSYQSGHNYERTQLCRGDHGRYWRIGIENQSGSKFQLDDLSLLTEKMNRKV